MAAAPPWHDGGVLTGRRFVVAGLTHLADRVVQGLQAEGAEVVVVGDPEADDAAREAADRIGDTCRIIDPGYDREAALRTAGLDGAAALLLLADDDLESLRTAAAAHAIAPHVPVVLRTFQPDLVDEVAAELNIRRAFSVAALAAPSFVAAAFGEEVVQTLRLGDEEVPICILDVHDGSPLAGRRPGSVGADLGGVVIAVAAPAGPWRPATAAEGPLGVGDRVLLGGRLVDVLDLARRNDEAEWDAAPPRAGASVGATLRRLARPTLLRVAAVLFALSVLANFAVRRGLEHEGTLDAVRTAVGISVGNLPPQTDRRAVKILDLLAIVSGVVLPWILLSYITAIVLAERLELRMARRARRMRDHVVLVGLGRVGYRVARTLADLGIPAAVIEEEPDSHFVDAVAAELPVVRGDGQLRENLVRCGIERARCIIACTNNDLANLAACREARRLHPEIRTVLRAFDETVSGRLATAFRIDATISSATVASRAFIGAAIDEFAMRPVELDGLSLLAYRFTPDRPVDETTLADWRSRGLQVLAVEHDGTVSAGAAATGPLIAGDEAVVIGPATVVRSFAAELE